MNQELREREIINIGSGLLPIKALVTKVYSESCRKISPFIYAEVVYHQNCMKGVKENITWSNERWEFIGNRPSGSYVNIELYSEVKCRN